MPDLTLLPLARLTIDLSIQSRAELDSEAVCEYAEALNVKPPARPAERPIADPVIVYFDGHKFWLAHGFHWAYAHIQIRRPQIECVVRTGTRRDAILCSVQANHKHGRRRTNADKRRAVNMLLDDPEWGAWPNTQIAARAGVDEYLVRKLKVERRVGLTEPPQSDDATEQASPEDVATTRSKIERAVRKSYRYACLLAGLTGRAWREVLEEQIAAAEAFERAKVERKKGA